MKLSGSYASIARGVSQQVAQQRLDGQHAQQTNLVSDPVIGLVRRRGSEYLADLAIPADSSGTYPAYMRGLKNFDFRKTGVQYSLLYPSSQAPVTAPFMTCYNKDTRQFMPVVFSSNFTRDLAARGVNKVAQVGDLLVLAVKDTNTEFVNSPDTLNDQPVGVVWTRSGNYSRTYRVSITTTGGIHPAATYTTPSANYPNALDTSDIAFSDPEYTKKVNDRVNAYNSAVTAWLTSSAAQTTPAYITQQLAAAIQALGFSAYIYESTHIGITDPNITEISVSDGGDGTGIKSIWKRVSSVSDLPYAAPNGKVVEIRPDNGDDAYFMVATVAGGGWGRATWVEAARYGTTPTFMFLLATVTAGTLAVADSPAALNAMAGMSLPVYSTRRVGDMDSAPMPNFFGKEITYVGTFQDRLVVCAGSVISMSVVGDYFNFFRASVLTVKDNDPVEVYALGADDDVIRHSVFFDKSMVFFGERQQYTVDGRVPITPGTTTVIQSSAHEDTTDAAPVSRGELVFFAKRREDLTKINQIEVGDVQDTSRVIEVSLQLYDYIGGKPVQLLAVTNPDMLLVRSTADYNDVITFRYLDRGPERLLDSWSRWSYPTAMGEVIGMTPFEDQIILFHHMQRGSQWYLVACSQSLLTQVDDLPYLDGRFDVATPPACYNGHAEAAIAVDRSHTKAYLQGERNAYVSAPTGLNRLKADYPDLSNSQCHYGFMFPAYVGLTSPFRRDRNGVAVTTGRLNIGRVDLSYRDTPGLKAVVGTARGDKVAVDFNGRLLGSASSEYPFTLATSSIPVFVGRESREYMLTIYAQDWRPFTLTAVEWTGQYFYNGRR